MKNNNTNYLILIGSIGLISFFLPFFSINLFITKIEISGISLIKSIFEVLDLLFKSSGADNFAMNMKSFTQPFISEKDHSVHILFFWFTFIWTGPVVFAINYIKMIAAGIKDKYYDFSFGTVYLIIYTIICFSTITYISSKIFNLVSFFDLIGIGFYLNAAATIVGHIYSSSKLKEKKIENQLIKKVELSEINSNEKISAEKIESTFINFDNKTFNNKEILDKIKQFIEEANYLPEELGCPFCHNSVILDRTERKNLKFVCPSCDNQVNFVPKQNEQKKRTTYGHDIY